jgi:O-antigen/teichoic acid export membrane protein
LLRLLKYVNNIRALQAFQLIRTGALFLISIIFTKKNPFTGEYFLPTGEIGIYETFLIIAGFVSFFWISGMLQSLLSVYNNNKAFSSKDKNPVFFNIFILFTLLGIIAAVFVWVLETPISRIIGGLSGGKIPYMKILFMYIVLSCPVNLIEYIYLLKNKPLMIIWYGSITFTLQVICVICPLLLGYDLGYGLYGLVFVNIIRFIWLVFIVYKYSQLEFSAAFLKEFIKLSMPLILSILIGGSASYIDSFLVSYKFDEATLAIFRYGTKELPFVSLLTIAFSNAMTPRFSDPANIKRPLLELRKGGTRLMHYIFPATLLIILTSKYLYPVIFNPNFADSAVLFNISNLLIIIRFIFVTTILIGLKDTKIIFSASILELTVNVILSIILIDFMGINGVAIATIIAYVINKIYLIYYLRKKHNIRLSQYLDLKVYYFYVACLFVCFFVSFIL